MSATIIPYLHGTSFDPDHVRVMGEAYDKARKMLHDKGQPPVVQDVIARRIIEIAETGERDPQKLCDRAMKALGLPGE